MTRTPGELLLSNIVRRAKLQALCEERLGDRDGHKVTNLCRRWDAAATRHGETMTMEQFLSTGFMSRRTAYRFNALLRQGFPELGSEATPTDLLRLDALDP